MNTIKDNRAGFDKLLKMEPSMFVQIGVQDGEKYKSEDGEVSDLVKIAAANEFGTARIPSRPFLRSTFGNEKANIDKLVQHYAAEAYKQETADGIESSLLHGLDRIGMWFASKVQNAIRAGSWTPNAPATIARKKSDRPLVDTGQLVQSIRHVVVG